MNRQQYSFIIIGSVLAFVTSLVSFWPVNAVEEPTVSTPEQSAEETTLANCRYGVTPLRGAGNPFDPFAKISELGAGWFLTFQASPNVPATENNAKYAPAIRIIEGQTNGEFNGVWYLGRNRDISGAAAETYVKDLVAALPPNTLWLIGNEIDRLTQDNITPDTYAAAYHEIYHWIKEVDPSAQVAISGLVEVTPLRLVYLDMIWNAYLSQFNTPMPVDVWNMHLYALPEISQSGEPSAAGIPVGVDLSQTTAVPKMESGGKATLCGDPDVYCFAEHDNMAVFAEQVTLMRQWMKSKGEQQKPLIISEYSILWQYLDTTGDGNPDFQRDEYGQLFSPQRIANFMESSFYYLESAKDPELGYGLDDNRLVQQWMWFSVHHPWYDIDDDGVPDYWNWQAAPPGSSSDLYRPVNPPANMALAATLPGETFKSHVSSIAPTKNLVIERVDSSAYAPPLSVPDTVTATLEVAIRNVGNTAVSAPFKVAFYDQNDALIGEVEVESVGGCGVYPRTVRLEWPIEVTDTESEVHSFSVHIDSNTVINESDETDNEATSFIIVNANSVFLPNITR